MATVDLTKDTLEDTINNNDFVIFDFWAPWCGPCQSFAPIYKEVSEKYPDVVFGKVNTEEEQELGAMFQIRSIPTLMMMREQVIIFSQAGMMAAPQFEDIIKKAQGLDMEEVHRQVAEQQEQAS